MQNKIGIFLPTRLGSERVLNKNTRPFAGIENGLLELKLRQLLNVNNCVIYLSTNDPESIDIANRLNKNKKIIVIKRPNELCLSSTPLKELIAYVPTIVKEDHILWTHVTSPFVESSHYNLAIETYNFMPEKYDSLMSVKKIQEFLWSEKNGNFFNFERELGSWPRTQDVEPLYEVNSAIFCASKKIYLKGDRIGIRPKLLEMNSIESLDIDWVDDFELAEILYEGIRK